MLKKVFRFLFSVCLIVLGIGMSLYPAVRSEKIHMEAISYQKEVDNTVKYGIVSRNGDIIRNACILKKQTAEDSIGEK